MKRRNRTHEPSVPRDGGYQGSADPGRPTALMGAQWVPPNYVQANPEQDMRGDGRVGSVVGCGVTLLICIAVVAVIGLVVFVMVEPL